MENVSLFSYHTAYCLGSYMIAYIIWQWFKRPCEVNIRGKRVVITGGSSGLGRALARNVVSRGAHVTIIARNQTRLDETRAELSAFAPEVNVNTISLDLSESYTTIKTCLLSKLDKVDVLINCAGSSISRSFLDSPDDVFVDQINQNYLSSVHVTKALLPIMMADGNVDGKRIAFVSSMGGQLTMYGFSAYSGSKYALRAFAEVLQQELEDSGPKVTIVYPPDMNTPGFASEQEGKPQVTQLFSDTAATWSPDVLSPVIIRDILRGRRCSSWRPLGAVVTMATSGISRPFQTFVLGPILDGLLEVILAPFIKVAAQCFAWYMRWNIKRYACRN